MAFQSKILAGNSRLDLAASGGPSVKPAPPKEDPDAVKRIQKALIDLGYSLPLSFPAGSGGEPDGDLGQETYNAILSFQRKAFPGDPSQWDGRVGRNTLAKMDAMLGTGPTPSVVIPVTMSALAEKDKATSIMWAQAAITISIWAGQRLDAAKIGAAVGPITPPFELRETFIALQTHFNISTAAVSPRDFINTLTNLYRRALYIIQNSSAYFIDDTTSAEAAKGTPAHVPYNSGKVNFTPSFKEWDSGTSTGFGPMCRAAMVLHEPFHIVDHPYASNGANHVHEMAPAYGSQLAANQIHNAHSYASFAQHVYFWRDTRYGASKPAL